MYRVTTNSGHYQIQCNHCYVWFLACPDSDCNYCVVNNKRAMSYMNKHLSSKKQKISTTCTSIETSTKDSTFQNQNLICTLCDVLFHNPTSPSKKAKFEINCPNCNETLLYCKFCGYLTNATFHGGKKLRNHQCIHNMKGRFHNAKLISTYKHQTTTESVVSENLNESILLKSLTNSNESAEDHEDSNDINFNISDGAAFQNFENNSMTCHRQEYGEVNLHPKDFY